MAESNFGDVIKRQSLPTLLGAIALVLVVGLGAGFGIGYKVEQSRTKSDVKKAEQKAAAKTATGSAKTPAVGTSVRVIGKVDATAAKNVTVTVNGKTSRKLGLQTGTLFVKAVPGSAADVTKGSRVVWKPKGGSFTSAEEIIVLPANARLGSLLTDVAAGSMTYKSNGKELKVTTTGATIEKIQPATKTDLATGSMIIAEGRQTKTGLAITEIIVLPAGSKFV
ncbi:MAG TPA: hypothetical protein VEZ15_04065 [Acidimicrobiia bacterium]|nr:hypothetical protein [Acidimicrobiia bacterium]